MAIIVLLLQILITVLAPISMLLLAFFMAECIRRISKWIRRNEKKHLNDTTLK